MKKSKVVVVMPAYNAAKTLVKTFNDIPHKIVDQVILVDDKSADETVQVARKLGLKIYRHDRNKGYGGNQKTCYTAAINENADIVVMIHPDYQYDPRLIPYLVTPIRDGMYDVMLGSRIRSRKEAIAGGMPMYKYIGNRLLTLTENFITGLNLSEYHTGLRAFDVKVVKTLPYNDFSDDFVFDQEFLISAHAAKFTIGEISAPVRYFPEASSINFMRSVKYGLLTLVTLIMYIVYIFGGKPRQFVFR